MDRSSRHDPVALFAFALRESDWVLAALIATSIRRRPLELARLRTVVSEAAGARASPSSLSELEGWARMSRRLGIGNGEVAGPDETQD